ncbi:transcription termination/antitermination NusG family protein, partial [Chloroflexota bacterium]
MPGLCFSFQTLFSVRLFVGENDKHWFVVHTYSGHEERVKKTLEQRIKLMEGGDEISQVIIPTEE